MKMAQIVSYIKRKMEAEGLTAYALEKRAGLKPSAVNNIIYGKSKNPSIEILKGISKALNCSVSDLIGEQKETSVNSVNPINSFNSVGSASSSSSANSPKHLFQSSNAYPIPPHHSNSSSEFANYELYTHCLFALTNILKKKKLWLCKEEIIGCADEIYQYSFKKGLKNTVDLDFTDWIIEKHIK